MGVFHTVPAGLPTGTSTGKVAGDDWRADHVFIPFSIEMILGQNTALTPAAASAAANTELHSTAKSCRNIIDLSQASQARLVGMVIATGNAAGASYKLSYSASADASTWAGSDAGPVLTVGSTGGGAGVMHDSGWTNLAAGAKVDNCRVTLLVGTALGTTAATVGFVTCYFK